MDRDDEPPHGSPQTAHPLAATPRGIRLFALDSAPSRRVERARSGTVRVRGATRPSCRSVLARRRKCPRCIKVSNFPDGKASDVDGRAGAAASLHVHRDGDADRAGDAVRAAEHGDRHLPGNQHSGDQRHLELQRPVGAGDGPAHRRAERARPDDDGERHRAHRVASRSPASRSSRSSSSRTPTSRRRSRRSSRSSRRRCASCRPASRRRWSSSTRPRAFPVVQLGLSSPTLPEQSLFDTAVNMLRPQLITIPGVAIPFPYGGKNRVDLGRPRHAGAAGARACAGRRRQRGQPAEPDPAVRHGQVRRHRVHGAR